MEAKQVLISGAAGTLGRAISRSFANKGYSLHLMDLDSLEAASKEIQGEGEPENTGSISLYKCDLADSEQVDCVMAKILAQNSIDILVNNAGVLSNNKLEATSLDEWQNVLAVNLRAAFQLSKHCVPSMKAKGWGRIINVCSLASKSGGLTAGTAYAVSKGGLVALTFSMARELAPHGITVNGVAPAYIQSNMVSRQLEAAERERILSQIPVGRFCEADEVAHTIAYLADPKSGFITGELIDQNGGLLFD